MLRDLNEIVKRVLIPALPAITAEQARLRAPATRQSFDAAPDDIKSLMGQVRVEFEREYSEDELQRLAYITGTDVEEWHKRQMNGQLKRVVDVDVVGGEPWLKPEIDTFAFLNTRLIESLPEKLLLDIETASLQGLQQGLRWEDISDEIEERFGVAESRADLIARDQVGKLQGQLTKLRQENLGIERYTWRTAQDGRVRDSHREKNGQVFRWDDPPADTGHPSEDFQCRCYAEPVLDDLVPEEDT